MGKLVEQLSGRGKVLVGEREIATANYSIDVYQDYIETNTRSGSGRIPGMKSASGQLNVVTGPVDLELSPEWTLVLSDGRRCKCVQLRMTLPGGAHTFNVSGNIS